MLRQNLVVGVLIFIGGTNWLASGKTLKNNAEIRSEKKIAAQAGFGLVNGVMSLTAILNGNNSIEYSNYSYNSFWSSNVSAESHTISWMHYFNDSFYLRGGIGQRRTSIKHYEDPHEHNMDIEKAIYTDYGIDIACGKRWQWEYVTLGWEFIGLYIAQTKPSISANSTEKAAAKARENNATFPNIRLTNITFGLSF